MSDTAVTSIQRTWTSVGSEFVERLGKSSVEHEIEALDWLTIPPAGSLSVGFMPGEAINTAIRELRLPKVSKIAISSFDRPGASPDEDGFYHGFYGIECHYKDGTARVYVLDTGTTLTPLLSDFHAEAVPA